MLGASLVRTDSVRSIQGQRSAADGSTLARIPAILHDELPVQFLLAADSDGTSSWCGGLRLDRRQYRAILGQRYALADRRRGVSSRSTLHPSASFPQSRQMPTGTSSWRGKATGIRDGHERLRIQASADSGGSNRAPVQATPTRRLHACLRDGGRRGRLRRSVGELRPRDGHERFSVSGSATTRDHQGVEFQVNPSDERQAFPSVAAAADGSFVVAWNSAGSSGTDTSGDSIQGQRYASDGSMEGAEFQVNTYTTDQQYSTSVAAFDGGVIMAWRSNGSSGTDTHASSILGQRFSLAAAVPAVPSMSSATRFALGAALLLLGAVYALRRRA